MTFTLDFNLGNVLTLLILLISGISAFFSLKGDVMLLKHNCQSRLKACPANDLVAEKLEVYRTDIATLKTKIELWWKFLEDSAINTLRKEDRVDFDLLLDKYRSNRINFEELQKLETILTNYVKEGDQQHLEHLLFSIVLAGVSTRLRLLEHGSKVISFH